MKHSTHAGSLQLTSSTALPPAELLINCEAATKQVSALQGHLQQGAGVPALLRDGPLGGRPHQHKEGPVCCQCQDQKPDLCAEGQDWQGAGP